MREVIYARSRQHTIDPKFTLRQLSLFVAAVRAGSFTAAASEERVSPSTVSVAVRELERALGVTLVRRRAAQGVEATAAGTAVAARGVALLGDAGELQLFAAAPESSVRGPVAVGCFLDLAPRTMPDIIESVAANLPAVDLDFTDEFVDVLRDHLDFGDLDFVIAYDASVGPGYDTTQLFVTQPHIVLPRDHPLASRGVLTPDDLRDEDAILLDRETSGDRIVDVLRASGLRPKVRYRTPNLDLAAILVGRGLGYCAMLYAPAFTESQDGHPLVALPLQGAPAQSVVAFWPRDAGLTARARAVLDLVR